MVTEKWHQAISQPVFKVEGWNFAHYYKFRSRWARLMGPLNFFFKLELWSKNCPQKHVFDHNSRTINNTDSGYWNYCSLIFFVIFRKTFQWNRLRYGWENRVFFHWCIAWLPPLAYHRSESRWNFDGVWMWGWKLWRWTHLKELL